MLLHGWADCSGLEEDKSFIMSCQSVTQMHELVLDRGFQIPALTSTWSGAATRADVKKMQLLVQHTGDKDTKTGKERVRNCLILAIDIKMDAVPDMILQKMMEECVGMLLWAFEAQCGKFADPTFAHALQMQQDPWYRDWLFPYLEKRIAGLEYPSWYMPSLQRAES